MYVAFAALKYSSSVANVTLQQAGFFFFSTPEAASHLNRHFM